MAEHPRIRAMQTQDLSSIVLIEAAAQFSPWGRLSFEEAIDREQWCMVLEDEQQILGYSICAPVLDELHVLNVVIAKHKQGSGLAHLLMQEIFDRSQESELKKIFLEVRQSNEPAISLYRRWGFEQISTRKDYYRSQASQDALTAGKTREDAIVMLRNL